MIIVYRNTRKGRDPQTGDKIKIKGRNTAYLNNPPFFKLEIFTWQPTYL
jgi:nucleoid DNA-binding protein